MATPLDVAVWLMALISKERYLYQDVAADGIASTFGEEFVHLNKNGNTAIDRRVLAEFRAISAKTVVWERVEKVWRLREDYDPPGRLAD